MRRSSGAMPARSLRAGAAMLELRQIKKVFGPTVALGGVDFDVRPGEVHALLGQNGSGKSTLMKIAYGELQADAGDVLLNGAVQRLRNPRDARLHGVAAVAQDVPLALDVSVTENVLLGALPRRGPRVAWSEARAQTAAILESLGSDINPRSPVRSLPPHERQTVAIARALGLGMRLLIFDEPTSSLSTPQADRLFKVMSALKLRDIAMVFITQRLKEIGGVADRVTVLRDGVKVGEFTKGEVSSRTLAELVTGRALYMVKASPARRQLEPLLKVTNLTHETMFQGVNLQVAPGEIVGVSGLMGCGRTELFRSLFGASHPAGGQIQLNGKTLTNSSPSRSIVAGMALVTGDRHGEGLVPTGTVQENLMMVRQRGFWFKKINVKAERELSARLVKDLGIRTSSLRAPVSSLSGGNQQKVVLAKWLALRPQLLILDEPTRGVDVAAKGDFYGVVIELAAQGVGVIVGSLDNQELLEVCHRILVMYRGQIVADLDAAAATEEELLGHASGLGSNER